MNDDCGCCATPAALVPGDPFNRPGLGAVAYRIGTFSTFRKAILDELSRTPALAGLTSRVSDDYTVTAVELWSAVADVLTFYRERITNEAFLDTAVLRDSVLRLVRLIDYQLRPGAAATTKLAFTMDAGATAVVPVGTRVQSVPREGEKPQKFETLAEVRADATLNRLRVLPPPRPTQPTAAGAGTAIVAPDADAMAAAAKLSPGDRVILYAPSAVEVLTLDAVETRDDIVALRWATPIASGAFAEAFHGADPTRRAVKAGRAFQLFGYDAPATVVVPQQKTPTDLTTTYLTLATVDRSLHGDGTDPDQIALDGRHDGLKPGSTVLVVGTTGATTQAVPCSVVAVADRQRIRMALPPGGVKVPFVTGTVTQLTLKSLGASLSALVAADIGDIVVHELVGAPLRFWPFEHAETLASGDVHLSGRRAGWSSVEVGRTVRKGAAQTGVVLDVSAFEAGRDVLIADDKGAAPAAGTVTGASVFGSGIRLGPTEGDSATITALGLAPDQAIPVTVVLSAALPATLTFRNPRRELSAKIGALAERTVSLDPAVIGSGTAGEVAAALQAAIRGAAPGAPTFARAMAWIIDGAIAVAPGLPGDRVDLGPSVDDADTIATLGLDGKNRRFLDGLLSAPLAPTLTVSGKVRVTSGLGPPRDVTIAASGPVADGTGVALAMSVGYPSRPKVTADKRIMVLPVPPVHEPRVFVRLALDLDGPVSFDAATAVLLGNVTSASHGETVRAEVLGDGDASLSFQRFPLRKKPVTFLSAPRPGGVANSLSLLVNGVRWTERASLYGSSPTDEIYITRMADDGTLTVQFGDGVTGARVPTGRQNIVAWYRQGIGVAGRVRARSLSTLLDRPTGVKGVVSPLAADGGADPESMVRAREAAQGTVRTFGRAVSLRDFEDTTLTAGEVTKATPTWVWNGERRAVHLTIAGPGGAPFSPDGLARISAALATARDPNHRVLVDNYVAVAVLVDATVMVDPRHLAKEVLAAARTALLHALSFEVRRFAEPVYVSDIFRVLQDVEGVVGVDVNTLDLKSDDAAFRAAHGIHPSGAQPHARLLMLPARPAGPLGAVLPAELAWVEAPEQDVILRAAGGLSL